MSLFKFGKDREFTTGDGPWVPPALPAKITPAQPAPVLPWVPPMPKAAPAASSPKVAKPVVKIERPRLVFAVDATSSRSAAWEVSKKLTDKLFSAVPGGLDVALAVHGGNRVHTFTPFVPDAASLRKLAAGVRCRAGYTRLLDILARVVKEDRVRVVVYIGDVFEESERQALRLADKLRRKETRVIILHDACSRDFDDGEVFRAIAERTGGAVLPFDYSSLERLGELLEAVAVLAVGGVEAVEEISTKPETPAGAAATLLLENLDPKRLLIGRR